MTAEARLLIEVLPGETRAALLRDGALADLRIARDARPSLVGNLYLARVRKVVPALGAAFLDLGAGAEAFLPLKGRKPPVEGEALCVRIDRPAVDDKAPRAARADMPKDVSATAPALLRPGPPPAVRAVADLAPEGCEVLVDDGPAAAAVRAWCRAQRPDLAESVAHDAAALFAREGVEAEVDALLSPEVPLAGGGRLFVETVRALTVIDVDSGGSEERGDADRFMLARNLAAMAEAARQLRLRAIGGQAVIDPVSLRRPGDRKKVEAALREAVADDPAGVQVHGTTALGLIELTRARRGPSLADLLTEPTPGGGRRPTAVTRAFSALRLARAGLGQGGRPVTLAVAPDVAAELQAGEAAAAWAALAERSGGLLRLRAEEGCAAPRLERDAA